MSDKRKLLRDEFLASCELGQTEIEALAQDASFRRYFRIHGDQRSYILMDAPPAHEDTGPFIKVAEHLLSLNLRAPQILHADKSSGFILLEDFGDNTFTRLLAHDLDETELYQLAISSLLQLQNHPDAANIELADYSNELLINEALLLCDWYYPKQTGNEMSRAGRSTFIECWNEILNSLPKLADTLVLRDFHVDNLIKLDDQDCGLLDFQDAVIGSPVYDVVSLLEDARRDISETIRVQMLETYFSQVNHERNKFMRWYRVLGAQRHCKVLGIFTRLSVRDGKHHYLDHLDRVEQLLIRHLDQQDLQPLKLWLTEHQLITG